MKRLLISSLFLTLEFLFVGILQAQESHETTTQSPHISNYVKIETDKGNILIGLYDETPKHRDNFLSLVKSHSYDGVIFHRVINRFMIQTGNLQTKSHAEIDVTQDTNQSTIEAEFMPELLIHKKGAVAAARTPDEVNPSRSSSATQFYIVTGNYFTEWDLKDMEKTTGQKFTELQKDIYKTQGGAPHLDGQYTVFGEVLEGMDTVSKIERIETDNNNRPTKNIRIKKVYIVQKDTSK